MLIVETIFDHKDIPALRTAGNVLDGYGNYYQRNAPSNNDATSWFRTLQVHALNRHADYQDDH